MKPTVNGLKTEHVCNRIPLHSRIHSLVISTNLAKLEDSVFGDIRGLQKVSIVWPHSSESKQLLIWGKSASEAGYYGSLKCST